MIEIYKKDFYRMTGNEYKNNISCKIKMLFQHNLRYMYWWRVVKKSPGNMFANACLYRLSRKYGIEIGRDAEIDAGLYLGHPYNITVAGGTIIGKNVNMHKGCTIGRENRGKREGTPTLENNIFIGINATIVGNIKIGSNVLIAPNSYVNFDVPDNSVVIGNPGKILHNEKATMGYVNFLIE